MPRDVPAGEDVITHAIPFPRGEAPTAAKTGRRSWDERMGETAAIAKNYRNVMLASVAALVVMSGFTLYQSMQTKVRVLEVSRTLDGTQIVGVAEGISLTPSDYIMAAELRRWIIELRTIFKDWSATRQYVTEAYTMIAVSSQAQRDLDQWFRSQDGDPYIRLTHVGEYVSVKGTAAVPMTHQPNSKGERTWRIEWTEESHATKDDQLLRTTYFSAIVTYFIQPHRGSDTDDQIRANPHGVMINYFKISS